MKKDKNIKAKGKVADSPIEQDKLKEENNAKINLRSTTSQDILSYKTNSPTGMNE